MKEGKIKTVIYRFQKSAIWILPIIFVITFFFGIAFVLILNGFRLEKSLMMGYGWNVDNCGVNIFVDEDSTYNMSDIVYEVKFIFEDGSERVEIKRTKNLPDKWRIPLNEYGKKINDLKLTLISVKVHNGGHIAGASILLTIAALSLGGEIFIIVKRALNKKRRIKQIIQNNENQLD